ncbi:DUF1513 domain-containing protein [Photobacterium leiognathi]|uniref:DUF1513 domain-containing protein n=1 Tax=Photobacterium leiognathi TaxID=553611 RepID=UPI002734D778|nr:DUF1513 domain-containing protein [Photobacterium leiognathi]
MQRRLVATHQRGQALQPLIEDEEWLPFNHYCQSIGTLDGFTCWLLHQEETVDIWDQHTRKLISLKPLTDASGVAMLRSSFGLLALVLEKLSVLIPCNKPR